MRVHAASAALSLLFILGSSALRADETPGGTGPQEASVASLPSIDVWYGNDQRFGVIGTPQRYVNILGTATHSTGIKTL
ncbi:hypothetical protein EHM92_03705, partial [bacterium]